MTSLEVRAVVTAYYRVQSLDAPPGLGFSKIVDALFEYCDVASDRTTFGRWATEFVGPVLAAGMGASTDMRTINSPSDLLRCFGLTGDRPLSPKEAWRIVRPYSHEPVLSETSLISISSHANMTFRKLPPNPGPVDVLVELTRHRSAPFLAQLARWIAEKFRQPGDNQYTKLYAKTLKDLQVQNIVGELGLIAHHALGTGRKFSREDWESIVHGRVPAFRLEERASYAAAKAFILDYYAHCREKDPKSTNSLDSESIQA
jgi:hypothetical protein